jgi:hypothetical protein
VLLLNSGHIIHVTYSIFATSGQGMVPSMQQLGHRHLDLVSIRVDLIALLIILPNNSMGCLTGWIIMLHRLEVSRCVKQDQVIIVMEIRK